MAIVIEENNKIGLAISSTTCTITGMTAAGANHNYIVIVFHRRQNVSSVAGLGLTWSLDKNQSGGRDQVDITTYKAYGNGTAGNITITMTTTTDTIVAHAIRVSGLDTTTPFPTVIGYNTNGLNGASSGGTDNNDLIASITTVNANSKVLAATLPRNTTFAINPSGDGWNIESSTIQYNFGSGAGVTGYVFTKDKAAAGALSIGVSNNLAASVDWVVVMIEMKLAPAATGTVSNVIDGLLMGGLLSKLVR